MLLPRAVSGWLLAFGKITKFRFQQNAYTEKVLNKFTVSTNVKSRCDSQPDFIYNVWRAAERANTDLICLSPLGGFVAVGEGCRGGFVSLAGHRSTLCGLECVIVSRP